MTGFPTMRCIAIGLAATALVQPALVHAQSSPSPYTSATRYDLERRVIGTIAPDPDGAGPLKYAAVRNSYNALGHLVRVETGELASWQSEAVAPANWSGFTVQSMVDSVYDLDGRKLKEMVSAGGTVHSVTQMSYDALGRLECTAVRMNPAAFAALPASACTLGTQGSHGPDRITRNVYDVSGRVAKIQKAYGAPLQQDYATYTYTANGKLLSVTDARGYKATMTYDGFDRQKRWYFPDKAYAATPSTTDYEEYGYDANGNRTSLRKRDGSTLTFQYDALNRMTVKVVPSRAGLTSTQTRDVYYDYDLRGLMTKARFNSLNGDGVTNGYNGFGELISAQISMSAFTRTLNYAYDKNGRRVELTHAAGGVDPQQKFSYARDGLGRVTSIYEGTAQTSIYQLIQASYDNRGLIDLMQRATAGNGFLADFGFDPVGRLSSLAQDAAGTANDLTISQSFNPARQIVSQTRSNDSYSWTGHVNVDRILAWFMPPA